ncbi:hypothetical protein Hanom_Chr07g00609821 [Helianthus anomalus]
MLVDESEKEDEDEAEAEADVEGDQVRLSPESDRLLKALNESFKADEAAKAAGDNEETVKDKKEREDKNDELYNPSPEHVLESQTPPSPGGRKKASARKRFVTPKVAKRLRVLLKNKPIQESSKPPMPLPEPQQQPSPIQSPLHQSPPKQPTPPHLSPLHQSPPHQPSPQSLSQIHIATPPHEQPVVTSQQIFQTPPSTQPPVQTTPGSSGYRNFPNVPENIPENIPIEDIGDFGFANDEQVKKLEKKIEEVLVENKKLIDREKKLEKRVNTVEAINSSLLERVKSDQAEIDILKVRIIELEEEKARRDEQNKYFKLKNKELEIANAKKEHEMYMINKVLENLLGKYVEQKFEEIEVEEVRARRQATIDAEMKNKGKGIEGVSEVA